MSGAPPLPEIQGTGATLAQHAYVERCSILNRLLDDGLHLKDPDFLQFGELAVRLTCGTADGAEAAAVDLLNRLNGQP